MSDTTLKALEAGTGGTDLGAISVMQSTTPVKISKSTIVDQTGAEVPFAKDSTVAAISTSLGTDGATPPAITGTGVRGWLRAIYERLTSGIGVVGTVEVANDSGNPLPVSGGVTVTNATAANLQATVTQTNAGNLLATVTQGAAGAQAWPVSGPLTDTQLRATAVPVAQTGTVATDPVGTENAPVMRTISKAVNLCVSAVGASAAAVTATLPAVAGQFHYITKIEIVLLATVARTAAATGVTVTSTNLPGGFAETFNTSAQALGVTDRLILDFNEPLKSSVANTATTIVCPATTAVLWRVNVFYYAAP